MVTVNINRALTPFCAATVLPNKQSRVARSHFLYQMSHHDTARSRILLYSCVSADVDMKWAVSSCLFIVGTCRLVKRTIALNRCVSDSMTRCWQIKHSILFCYGVKDQESGYNGCVGMKN